MFTRRELEKLLSCKRKIGQVSSLFAPRWKPGRYWHSEQLNQLPNPKYIKSGRSTHASGEKPFFSHDMRGRLKTTINYNLLLNHKHIYLILETFQEKIRCTWVICIFSLPVSLTQVDYVCGGAGILKKKLDDTDIGRVYSSVDIETFSR
jgi:hypothetical protein